MTRCTCQQKCCHVPKNAIKLCTYGANIKYTTYIHCTHYIHCTYTHCTSPQCVTLHCSYTTALNSDPHWFVPLTREIRILCPNPIQYCTGSSIGNTRARPVLAILDWSILWQVHPSLYPLHSNPSFPPSFLPPPQYIVFQLPFTDHYLPSLIVSAKWVFFQSYSSGCDALAVSAEQSFLVPFSC